MYHRKSEKEILPYEIGSKVTFELKDGTIIKGTVLNCKKYLYNGNRSWMIVVKSKGSNRNIPMGYIKK